MTKLINTALLAALLAGASITGVEAAKRNGGSAAAIHNPYWVDQSDPYGGFAPNSAAGIRAFWDYQTRQGTGR